MALLREGRRKIQRGGRLGDAALLVGERDDLGLAAGHVVLRSRSGKPIEDGYSRAGSVVLLDAGQPELALQALGAGVRDVHRAAAVGAPQPAELEQPAGERAAERAGEVVGLLGPVDAVAQREAVGVL